MPTAQVHASAHQWDTCEVGEVEGAVPAVTGPV